MGEEVLSAVFDTRANLQYAGLAYKAYSEMLEPPNRIVVENTGQGDLTVLPVKSEDNSQANILISNFDSVHERYLLDRKSVV